jgi:hypothetical protein
MWVRRLAVLLFSILAGTCGTRESEEDSGGGTTDIIVPDEPAPGVAAGCGSVRLTAYEASDSGWCEFSDTHAILPEFVQQRMSLALTRRVPCPVSGNIHAQLNDRNEWGYVRLAFINHRFPIRTAEYRAADGEEWVPVQRSGGAWHVVDDNTTFADSGPGGVFRFTSPTGESVEGSSVLTPDVGVDQIFDTGAQFAESEPEGTSCEFVPPGDVYDEEWGGIDQVRWACNPWGAADCSETTEGCAEGSDSCVLIRNLEQWDGFHIYYRQSFPTSTFSRLSLQLRTRSGGGEVVVAPSNEGERCAETTVSVSSEWAPIEIDVAASCTQLAELNALTLSNQTETMDVLVDEICYE